MNATTTTTTLADLFASAAAHQHEGAMSSSARLCLEDAHACLERGDETGAASRALHSLAYSVGILHPEHRAGAAFVALSGIRARLSGMRQGGYTTTVHGVTVTRWNMLYELDTFGRAGVHGGSNLFALDAAAAEIRRRMGA